MIMKKQLLKYFSLSALSLAFAISCAPTPAEPGPDPVMASEGIELKVDKVTDYGCEISLAPKGAANYYGYMVLASDKVVPFDSLGFYRGTYTKDALKFELFKYTSVKDTVVVFKGLKPNTDYVVYAVSSSPTGVPSNLVSAQIKTTDTGNPEMLQSAGAPDGGIVLSFSEPVTMASGAVLTVRYYAGSSIPFLTTRPRPSIGSVVLGADKFTFDGNMAKTKVEGLPAGALYSVHAPAGAFVDVKNNPCDKIVGGYYKIANKNFKLGKFEVPDTLRTIVNDILFGLGKDGLGFVVDGDKLVPGVDAVNENGAVGSFKYYSNDNGRISYEVIKLTSENYSVLKDFSKGFFSMTITPKQGDSVKVTIPEGAYIDIYGNSNAADSVCFVYYHDLSDFIGTYKVTGKDLVADSDITDYIVIDKSDKKYITVQEEGDNIQKPVNVMIKYWLKTMTAAGASNVYGYWDYINNNVTFYQGKAAFYTDASSVSYFFSTEDDFSLVLEAPTGGYLFEPSSLVELYSGAGPDKVRSITVDTFEAVRISKSTEINAGTNLPADI